MSKESWKGLYADSLKKIEKLEAQIENMEGRTSRLQEMVRRAGELVQTDQRVPVWAKDLFLKEGVEPILDEGGPDYFNTIIETGYSFDDWVAEKIQIEVFKDADAADDEDPIVSILANPKECDNMMICSSIELLREITKQFTAAVEHYDTLKEKSKAQPSR